MITVIGGVTWQTFVVIVMIVRAAHDWRNHGSRTSSYKRTPIAFGFFAGCSCLYHFYSCLILVPWSPKMPAYTRAPKGQGYLGGRLVGWFEANTATLSNSERWFLRLSYHLPIIVLIFRKTSCFFPHLLAQRNSHTTKT